ncbi:hypothetical protein SAMN04487910_2222 [Aquimarina amphilecti]|uniref:Uncharacterized protein n=1 Tax=Aquimarina amphilecti TaxID=1038014 RepID=A0A1H7PIC8_AQUAM|nr:hypothetical protein [Aquimarina amphilecti]SEL35540.1 hypothetical protein SAMN04487910_2222 [Aquimarina amphilecti]
MKKKKLNGLSLKKNIVSRLGSLRIKGGDPLMSRDDCPTGKFYCPTDDGLISEGCAILTIDCGPTEVNCHSIHINCE